MSSVRWLEIDWPPFAAATLAWSAEEIGAAVRGAFAGRDDLDGIARLHERFGRVAVSPSLRAAIFARDGAVCRYCGDLNGPFEVDHIHPVARGGTNDPENLCVACETCNRSKGARLLSEWLS
jgi:hypothetical protein